MDGIQMSVFKILSVTTAGLILSGCAAHPDPIIDKKGVDEEVFAQDWSDCESYSEEVVIAKGVAKGAATGAVVGGIVGAIGGDAGEGAGYGAVWGSTESGLDADWEKREVFKRCMVGRGYRVLN